ncbi:MAG: FtsQ-type POTRA domain-containing protein [Deltaproteobacteria bacterium]|nr:FtsQ-type POTRA domain-containing protein [Candidatus Tharpella aukensis]
MPVLILRRPEKSKQRVRISNSRKDLRRARRPQTRSVNRKLLLFMAFVCLGGLGGGALWLWWPTLISSADGWLKRQDFFLVKEIIIEGNRRSSRKEIVEALELVPRQLIFSFNLAESQDRVVRSLPFVGEIRIRRRWPNRLEIAVKERQAKALFYLDKLYLVDRKGNVIAPVPESEKLDYPLINGALSSKWQNRPEVRSRLLKKAIKLLLVWEEMEVDWPEKIAQIVPDEVYGLTVFTTDQGWELQLGLDRFDEHLRRWRQVLAVLGERAMAVKYFDCAGNDSVVVGLRSQMVVDDVNVEEHVQK